MKREDQVSSFTGEEGKWASWEQPLSEPRGVVGVEMRKAYESWNERMGVCEGVGKDKREREMPPISSH